MSVGKAGPACGHGPELQQSHEKAQDAYRLRRLKAVDPVNENVPA